MDNEDCDYIIYENIGKPNKYLLGLNYAKEDQLKAHVDPVDVQEAESNGYGAEVDAHHKVVNL